jgi:hypothetical protein
MRLRGELADATAERGRKAPRFAKGGVTRTGRDSRKNFSWLGGA